MPEDRNMFNQDLKAEPAWSISSGYKESGPGAFPDLNSSRALVNFFGEKSPKIHLSGGVKILQSWDTSLTISLADSQLIVLYTPFLTNCEAIELLVMEQRRRVCLVLPVKLLIIFHANPMECVKSIFFTASDQQFSRFSSRWDSKVEVAELLYLTDPVEKPSRGVHTSHSNTVYSNFCDRVESTTMLLQI